MKPGHSGVSGTIAKVRSTYSVLGINRSVWSMLHFSRSSFPNFRLFSVVGVVQQLDQTAKIAAMNLTTQLLLMVENNRNVLSTASWCCSPLLSLLF